MAPIRSKGKWLPGAGPGQVLKTPCAYYPFFCNHCNRGFMKGVSYERHLSTELHFSRLSKSKGTTCTITSYEKDPDFFEKVITSRPRPGSFRACKDKNSKEPQLETSNSITNTSILTCPTCYSKVNEHQIGKHLISHFHWQAAASTKSLSLNDKTFILTHIHDVVRQSPFQCYNCKFYFTKKEQLTEHFSNFHLAEQSENAEIGWTCSSCFESSTSTLDKDSMFKHLNAESHRKVEVAIGKSIPIIIRKIRLFRCKECNKTFPLRRRLFSHCRKAHFSNDCRGSNDQCLDEVKQVVKSSKLSCPSCSYSSSKKSHYDRHIKIHDSKREKHFKCNICQSQFFEKYALKFHKQTHHGKELQCGFPGCDFHGRCKSDLTAHQKVHDETNEFNCDKCNFSSKTKFNLKRHKVLLHKEAEADKMPTFSCDRCNFKSNLKHVLMRHLKTHEGLTPCKNYHCPKCDYKSRDMELLRKHFIGNGGHKDDNLYKCVLCLDTSNSNPFSSNLFNKFKSHILTFHKKKKSLFNSSSTDEFLIYAVGLIKKEV